MTFSDVDVAVAAARAGAEVVASAYGNSCSRLTTAAADFATRVDLDAETAIMDVLERHRPGDARLGEESGRSGSAGATRRWLVDPLCGTLNHAAATPLVVVNVALMSGDATVAAVAADPISQEIFWTDGARATRRQGQSEEALRPSARSRLVEINCDGPLDQPFVGGQLVGDPLLRQSFGPRVISTTLGVAWVAAGRRAAYVSDGEFRDNVHFAAGIALCEAAGCKVSDLAGEPLHTGRGLVVSADQETQDRMISLVGPHLRRVLSAA